MKNFYLWVIGCQYNEYDGARLGHFLREIGLEESEPEDADVILILACSVRQTAIDRIFGKLKHWQDKKVLISGCVLPTDKNIFLKKGIKFFDPEKFEELPKILGIKTHKAKKYLAEGISRSEFVPIMVGCNNFCSYCAVPYTRGRERSRPFDDVVPDVQNLINVGYKNITLLGQNVNSYKISQKSKIKNQNDKLKSIKNNFAYLLATLNDLPGDFEISFTSNHPKDMSDEIIETVARLSKIKKEIHLPLQSGSDKILKAMSRPYTVEEYLRLVKKVRSKVKSVEITTDVIVGFPGETKKDFHKTVDVFRKVKFAKAYINKYSPRAGTAAYRLGDPISWVEKQRRWRVLDKIANPSA